MIIISILTILLRMTAAVLSLFMIKVTGRRWIWIVFASASIIKLIKDIPAFIEKNINAVHVSTNLMGEIPSLMISGLVLVGVYWVYSLFKSINKSEAALEENNSFLNSIFLGMPDSLMLIDSNYKILSVNSQFETDYTNNGDDLTGKYCYQLTHGKTKPCDDTDHPCPMDTVFKQGIPVVLEHINKDHDGKDIYLELSCFPIKDSEGNVTSMVELAHNITDRKLAENRIIKERDKAQMYLDVAEVIIIIYDSEGIIVQINKKGCDLLEYSESELIGENWFDTVLLPEHRSIIKSKFAKIASGEISHNKYYENTILTKSGKVLMVSWHSNMLYNEEGKINGAISSGIDITVQIRMKDRIKTLSQAVDQSPSITIITDIEGDIEYVNPKFTEITGFLPGEVIGSNPRILKSGDFSREDYTSLWKAITSGKEWRGEFHNKKKNGELYWEAASISSIKDEDGTIKHFLAVKADITKRKEFETALKKSESRSLIIQRIAGMGVWEWDVINNIDKLSKEVCTILGLDPHDKDLSYNSFLNIVHPDDRERVNNSLLNSISEKTDHHITFRLLLEDGTVKHVEDWASHSFDSTGKHLYTTGIMQDITLRVKYEEQIKTSLKEKEALLRELYHRTKNNMQVISSMLGMRSFSIDNEKVSTVFLEMENRIQSMSLVHEKLYESHNLSSINLKDYIIDLSALMKNSYILTDREITFYLDLEEISILIDTAMPLGLILNELILNAIKHAFPDNTEGEISISLHKLEDSTIEIKVNDNGIGVDKDYDFKNGSTLGIQTVFLLCEDQLNGVVNFDGSDGLTCRISFKDTIYEPRV